MRIFIVWLFLFLSLSAVAESGEVTLGILEYVDRFLANAVELESAVESAAGARDAYENARIGQQSLYNLGLLESEFIYREAQIVVTENAVVRLAIERVFSSLASASVLRFAITYEEIAEAVYARSQELSRKEYISVRDSLIDRIAYLQASTNTRNAIVAHATSQKMLIRAIEGSMAILLIDRFELGVSEPEIPGRRVYIDRDPMVVKLRTNLPLYRERREFLLESESFSPAELETIEQTIDDTEGALQERVWLLQDQLEQLHSQLDALVDAREIAEIEVRVKSIDLEQARYQYESGDVYASDLAAAELALALAMDEIAALERNRLLLVIDALTVSNIRVLEWIGDVWGE